MVNGMINFCTTSDDFGLERRDARVQLINRQAIEIVARELRERVIGSARENFFSVHAANVDRSAQQVNKAPIEHGV